MTAGGQLVRAPWGVRLAAACAARGRVCVGVDPHTSVLTDWGMADDVTSLERCARGLVAAVGEQVAVFKPQSAFFERFGSAGVAVLERVLADISQAGALSILDAKRGDIGSTMAAYAQAYLADGSPLAADALTVNPYLGVGALQPAVDVALAHGRGLYLLARTSNPDGSVLQLAEAQDRSVAQLVCDDVTARNRAEVDARGPSGTPPTGAAPELGSLGVVVGGTHGQGSLDLAGFNGSVLVPGVGFQGARVADLARSFSRPELLLPTSSRGVLAAGPDPAGLQAAVQQLQAEATVLAG